MIHYLPHPISEGLKKENEAQRPHVIPWTAARIGEAYPTVEAFCKQYRESAEGQQLREALRCVPSGARILDVGAGYGSIALFLASQGYQVTLVEPSPDLCVYIERAAHLYELPLDIYNVTAECTHLLPVGGFDVCMFNASLHHCDEPVRALINCHSLLAPEGILLVMNEPLLQLFRSKAWFARRLEKGELVSGDYGGNEHTYYYHEYRDMLRQAGFAQVKDSVAFRYRDPHSYFRSLQHNEASRLSLVTRKAYYKTIAGLFRLGVFGKPAVGMLKRLSLLQTNFMAAKEKPAA